MTLDLITFIVAYALQYSYVYNSRRTEDVTHASWAAIMADMCRFIGKNLLATPQFRIFASPNDNPSLNFGFDGDASYRTLGDSKAKGVITELCVLIPVLARMTNKKVLLNLEQVEAEVARLMRESHGSATREGLYKHFVVPTMFVPVLVELKRPLSRHFSNVRVYVNNLEASLDRAQRQVMLQASCLFSTSKYAAQDYVILIAAAGEWWTIKVIQRNESQKFVMEAYEEVQDESDELQKTEHLHTDEELHQLDEELRQLEVDDWENDLAFHKPKDVAKVVRDDLERAEDLEKRRENRQLRERLKLENRDANWSNASAARKEMFDFLQQTDAQYCSEADVRKYYRLNRAIGGKKTSYQDAGVVPDEALLNKTILSGLEFSSPMKVGSAASNAYIEFIQRELRQAAKDCAY